MVLTNCGQKYFKKSREISKTKILNSLLHHTAQWIWKNSQSLGIISWVQIIFD
jgi:hypothetical protein